MNKNKAIVLINKSHAKISLTGNNSHWANLSIYGKREGWWLNVPFSKFEADLYLILNNEKSGQILLIHIPSSSISEPKSVFRNKENAADIFIHALNTNQISLTDPLIDTQSNSSGYDFSPYLYEVIEYSNGVEIQDILYPEEVLENLNEGSIKTVMVNSYERNPKARSACLKVYGLSCTVCAFNFEAKYGERGKGFIHVHHLNSLSDIGGEYEIDPIADLRPVCPNCHAMLHRKGNISIEELKDEIKLNKKLNKAMQTHWED